MSVSTVEHGKAIRSVYLTLQARQLASTVNPTEVAKVATEMWFRSQERVELLQRIGSVALNAVELS